MKPYGKKDSLFKHNVSEKRNKVEFKKKNKFNAKKTSYNGYNYDSGLEADYAKELDWRLKLKEVKSWTRQHRFDLRPEGIHWRHYKIDFRAELYDGTIEYIEVKGFPTPEWKQKWDMTIILFDKLAKGENAKLILSTKSVKRKVVKEYFGKKK